MTPRFDLVCIGFTVLDVLARHVDALPAPGESKLVDEIRMTAAGTAAGPAVIASRLGLSTRLIGSIGADRMGDVVMRALAEEKVDVAAMQVHEGVRTSTSILPITPAGERPAFHAPGASLLLALDAPFEPALGSRFLHYGGAGLHPRFDGAPARDLLERAKQQGTTVTCDVIAASADTLAALEPILPFVDYFMPTAEEARAIASKPTAAEAARVFLDLGAGACVFKDGARGSQVFANGSEKRVAALVVDVVDTTGCGDAYCAGFVAALSRGADVDAACRFASGTAALVATGLGSDAGVESYEATAQTIERLSERPIDQEGA
jgi:sugar/nucleoside kinase (ribokinase family)